MWNELKVANLMQVNAKQWNTAFINYVFDSNTAEQIYKTPLLPSVHKTQPHGDLRKMGITQFEVHTGTLLTMTPT
jgi:hypothetical protein